MGDVPLSAFKALKHIDAGDLNGRAVPLHAFYDDHENGI